MGRRGRSTAAGLLFVLVVELLVIGGIVGVDWLAATFGASAILRGIGFLASGYAWVRFVGWAFDRLGDRRTARALNRMGNL